MRIISAARRAWLASAVVVLATAGTAQAAVVHATVVHRNARAHSFVVADRAGHLYAIHAGHSPRLASVVSVTTRRLRNGTFAARRTHVLGLHRGGRVRLRGVVSYVDRPHGTFTLSARGVSMLVRTGRGRMVRMAVALPSVGSVVTTTGTVDDQGDLNDDTVQVDGTDTNGFELEGTILAIDATGSTITVSPSDDDQTTNSIVVSVPSTLDISMFAVGEEAELKVIPQPDGTYELSASSSDEGVRGADDQGEQQGGPGEHQGDGGSAGDGSDGGSDGTGTDGSGGSGSSHGDG